MIFFPSSVIDLFVVHHTCIDKKKDPRRSSDIVREAARTFSRRKT